MPDQDKAQRRLLRPADPVVGVVAVAGLALLAAAVLGEITWLPALVVWGSLAATAWLLTRRAPASASSVPDNGRAPVDSALGALLDGLPDPVVVTDREGVLVAANGHARRLAPALRRGQPASLALRMPPLVEALRRAAATGEPQSAQFSDRGAIDRWFEAHLIAIDDPERSDGGLLLITMRDLTPLRQSEAMRADFVANASHELRTPLASLSGFIETLQGPARDDPAARARFLDIMKAQANRMARLIDDLLSLSRIERTAHIHPEAVVDLVLVIRQVVDALQMLARERGVEVSIAAPSEPVDVLGDRDELYRVFENLLENALKYGASGKRVEITLSNGAQPEGRKDQTMVTVRDFGPGIAPEHLPRLTERFYRIDVGQSRAEGGTGLGLALVKHIINRHRGRLTIESEVGKGALFRVLLPTVDAEK